jgi:hypothetical protein
MVKGLSKSYCKNYSPQGNGNFGKQMKKIGRLPQILMGTNQACLGIWKVLEYEIFSYRKSRLL